MPTYRILASRTELHTIEAHVRARNADEAEDRFYESLYNEHAPLHWDQEFDSSDTEINSIELVLPGHGITPLGIGTFTMCGACGGQVVRSGDNSGWLHASDSYRAEGIGF